MRTVVYMWEHGQEEEIDLFLSSYKALTRTADDRIEQALCKLSVEKIIP